MFKEPFDSTGGQAGPSARPPHGYMANNPSDLMLFTNPLIKGGHAGNAEDRYAPALP